MDHLWVLIRIPTHSPTFQRLEKKQQSSRYAELRKKTRPINYSRPSQHN